MTILKTGHAFSKDLDTHQNRYGGGGIRSSSRTSCPLRQPRLILLPAPSWRLFLAPLGEGLGSNPSSSGTLKPQTLVKNRYGGGGIRTLDTLWGYNSLAGSPIRPLSHPSNKFLGAGGIRTHGTLRYNGFQDRLLKPLGHRSRRCGITQ